MRLDVTEILNSPEFMDIFNVTRQTNIHAGGGRYTNYKETKKVHGVVTQAEGTSANISTHGKVISSSISVYTSSLLTAGFGIRDGDLVSYNHCSYKVTSVKDYSRYGAGFVIAHCEMESVGGGHECEC